MVFVILKFFGGIVIRVALAPVDGGFNHGKRIVIVAQVGIVEEAEIAGGEGKDQADSQGNSGKQCVACYGSIQFHCNSCTR